MRFPCTSTCATQTFRGEVARWVFFDLNGFRDALAGLNLVDTWRDPDLYRCIRVVFGQLDTLRRPRYDRFTIAFINHAPEGGSVVEAAYGRPLDATDIAAELAGYRAGPGRGMADCILDSWLSQAGIADHVRLIDSVIFYLVRPLRDTAARRRWTAAGAAIAARTGDVSLNETLVWSLGPKVEAFPALVSRLRELRASPQVSRALDETGAGAIVGEKV